MPSWRSRWRAKRRCRPKRSRKPTRRDRSSSRPATSHTFSVQEDSMQRSIRILSGAMALSLLSVGGCATVVPRELADARNAYQHASASRASDLSPAELHKAKEALVKAEESWSSEPESAQTLDLSYVAQRKAQLAEAMAGMELAKRQKSNADQSINSSEHAIAKRTAGELNQTREQLAESQRNAANDQQALGAEHQARMDADKRSADADLRAKAAQDA